MMQSLWLKLTTPDQLPLLLAFALLAGFLIGWSAAQAMKRHGRRRTKPSAPAIKIVSASRNPATDQLATVMKAEFHAKRLMSREEARIFYALERGLAKHALGWRVMAQVSLGEVLGSADTGAFQAVNSKRVDMLIIAKDGLPIAAVEYQGSGHYQGTAAARDAVKREALRRAGIEFLEIRSGHAPEELTFEIDRLVRRRTPAEEPA
ncbi:DUF2726 domain-containing protein [Brevundimonas sp.]|uniref:DUF2726 domain-containing protein n=1 Tax=Brevundimonas sp. TaxID=1871086 RepID=UPI0028A5FFC5|nr:DUF2726 domain-containing protein [Brevundimonas sp.]